MQFVKKEPAARLVGLEPLAVDHQLRYGPLAHVAHHLGRGGRIIVHVDFCISDAVRIEKLLGGPAIPATGRGVDLDVHGVILLDRRC